MSYLKDNPYVRERLLKIIEKEKWEHRLGKAAMKGVLGDLESLKPIIENLYDEKIFYLDYWETDCPYHGWDWKKDEDVLKNMSYICDEIAKKFEEIYALILIGLGEDMEETEDDQTCNNL